MNNPRRSDQQQDRQPVGTQAPPPVGAPGGPVVDDGRTAGTTPSARQGSHKVPAPEKPANRNLILAAVGGVFAILVVLLLISLLG